MSAHGDLTESEIEAAKQALRRGWLFHPAQRGFAGAPRPNCTSRCRRNSTGWRSSGELFSGGGLVSGHLNCFPGAGARFVYETLQRTRGNRPDQGTAPERRAHAQRGLQLQPAGQPHAALAPRPPFDRDFMIANVTVVDTNLRERRHRCHPRFAPAVLQVHAASCWSASPATAWRIEPNRGDVVVRSSNVWHRGHDQPHQRCPRPMLAFTWEDGGSTDADPFTRQRRQDPFPAQLVQAHRPWAGCARSCS